MTPQRLQVGFPLTRAPEDLGPAIELFHRCIQRGLVEGQLLDVADYRHVPGGPGVMLIAHDIDYSLSHDALTVVRKRQGDTDAAQQLRDLLRMGLGAWEVIAEDDAVDVAIDASTVTVAVLDRRLGDPDDVAQALATHLRPVVEELYGPDVALDPVPREDARRAPAVVIDAQSAAAAGVLQALGGSRAPLQSPWDIHVEELAKLRADGREFVLLDVREESEYQTVNLGGTLIPLAGLGQRLEELERDAHVVVHCRAGRRGAKAVTLLRENGFDNAWNVNGGLMAWIDRVDPSLPRY